MLYIYITKLKFIKKYQVDIEIQIQIYNMNY